MKRLTFIAAMLASTPALAAQSYVATCRNIVAGPPLTAECAYYDVPANSRIRDITSPPELKWRPSSLPTTAGCADVANVRGILTCLH